MMKAGELRSNPQKRRQFIVALNQRCSEVGIVSQVNSAYAPLARALRERTRIGPGCSTGLWGFAQNISQWVEGRGCPNTNSSMALLQLAKQLEGK